MFIEFDGIINARDLGGIRTADGRRVKSGRLLRSAGLGKASDRDLALLRGNYALAHIVDFRDAAELAREPDRPVPGAEMHALPALPGLPSDEPGTPRSTEPKDFAPVFRRIYTELAESEVSARAYREFFRILLAAEGRTVLWHCTQGKDRTGVAGLLLLTALGVPEESAMEDYFLSNDGLRPLFESMTGTALSESAREKWAKLFFVYPEFIAVYTEALSRLHGGLRGYLTQRLGLTESELLALREFYTE